MRMTFTLWNFKSHACFGDREPAAGGTNHGGLLQRDSIIRASASSRFVTFMALHNKGHVIGCCEPDFDIGLVQQVMNLQRIRLCLM